MSWTAVNLSLVKYSPIEGTHYFYDPAYPTAIQFLLNGRWEPWDVGWVKTRAQDPDIKRIAEDAEARLLHDHASRYRPWPQESPTHTGTHADLGTNGHVPHPPAGNAPSPTQSNGASSTSTSQPCSYDQPQSPPSLSPTSPRPVDRPFSSHRSAPHPYTSPYASQPALPPLNIPQERNLAPQPQETHASSSNGVPQFANGPPGSNLPDTPASPLPLSPNRDIKILLSLDGDGVRGLSTVLIVESLINAICSKMGRRVDPYQIFDLIGGVSTTGFLAIVIGRLRMRVHRAREAYANIAKAVYLNKRNFFISFDPHAPTPSSNDRALEENIKKVVSSECENSDELFFDQRADSTNVFVISTKVEIGSNQPAIVRSYPTRRMAGPEVDSNLTVRQAIYATLVAPRYMDPQGGRERRAVIEPGLVDYGTGKNNPIRDLYYECRKLYSYTNDTMVVVSIGTGSGFDRLEENNEMANSVEDRTADAKVIGDKFESDNWNLIEQGWMKYFRFNVQALDDVSLDEAEETDRVMERTHAYLGQPDVGQRFYACVDAIAGVLMGDRDAWPRGI